MTSQVEANKPATKDLSRAGGIVATALVPHVPTLGLPRNTPEYQLTLAEGLKQIGESIRQLQPDLLVIQSTHWLCTFDWFVTGLPRHKGICVADEAPNLIPGIAYDRPGDAEFAAALAAAAQQEGIPFHINLAQEYDLDYGTYVPISHMDPNSSMPFVSLPAVLMANLNECIAIGRLTDSVARECGKKVVYLASTALSHKLVRGRPQWPTPDRLKKDRAMIDLLLGGKIEEAVQWLPQYAKDVYLEVEGKVFAGMLGATQALQQSAGSLRGQMYGEYAQSSGSGNANLLLTPAS